MKVSKIVKYVISLALAALLLYFSFRGIDWDDFRRGFDGCIHGFIFLAMAASVAAAFLRSLRWRLLMKPFDSDLKIVTAFDGVNIGYLANFVFPRIGEIVRCGFISRRSRQYHASDGKKNVSFEQAVGTVLLSRTWDLIVIFALVGVLLATRWEQFGNFFTVSIITPVEEKLNLNVWWVAAILAFLVVAALYLVYHFRLSNSFCAKVSGFCRGIVQGFAGFARMEGKGLFLAYTVGMWVLYWLMSMSIIWALPHLAALNGMDAWFLCLAGSVAWIVPVPGGFGAYHYIVALAVSSIYGYSWEDGMLYATLNHEAQAIVMIVCGLISFAVEIMIGNRMPEAAKKIKGI